MKYALHLSPVSGRSSLFHLKRIATGLFSRHRYAILVPRNRLLATEDIGNACRPLLPLRDGDRTEQTLLTTDFPGADAGLPGAVRAGHDRAVQADRHGVLRQSRSQRADRRRAFDRHHPVIPASDPAL